jgi:hypothetical protein
VRNVVFVLTCLDGETTKCPKKKRHLHASRTAASPSASAFPPRPSIGGLSTESCPSPSESVAGILGPGDPAAPGWARSRDRRVTGHAYKGETGRDWRAAGFGIVCQLSDWRRRKYPKLFCKPILAELSGTDCCTALGFAVQAAAPVLALCRRLIQAGYDAARHVQVRSVNVFTATSETYSNSCSSRDRRRMIPAPQRSIDMRRSEKRKSADHHCRRRANQQLNVAQTTGDQHG